MEVSRVRFRIVQARRTLLGVDLSDVACLQLVLCEFCLLLDSLLVALCQGDELLQPVLVSLALDVEVVHLQRLCPDVLVQIHEHVLLERRLAVVDADRVVVAVEAVDEGLDGGLVEVADVGGGLAGLVAHHEGLRVDEAEGIDDDLALDGLDGVDDDGDGAGSKLLERLLCVDVDRRQPAAETGMRVVPADDCLLSAFVSMSSAGGRAWQWPLTCLSDAACPSSWSGRRGRQPRPTLLYRTAAWRTRPPPVLCSRRRTRPA